MRFVAASLVLTIVSSQSYAQLSPASTFTITNGQDTIAVERFTHSASSLTGDLRLGSARQANHARYTIALRPDGSASRVEINDDRPNFYTGLWVFDADAMRAARAEPANHGVTIRMAPPSSYPTIGTSLALMEQLMRATHPAIGDSVRIQVINIRNGFDAPLMLKRTAADSALIVCDGCMQMGVREEIHVALSSSGDILGGSNPSLNWTITRR
jgi:hypothetical protein